MVCRISSRDRHSSTGTFSPASYPSRFWPITHTPSALTRLVAAAAHILPQLPRLADKIPVDVLLFFVNYLLQKKFVY